jgi:hypothetical protein
LSRQDTISSYHTAQTTSATQQEVWRQIRKDLEAKGVTSEDFERHRALIVTTVTAALLDEDLSDISITLHSSPDSSAKVREYIENFASKTPDEATNDSIIRERDDWANIVDDHWHPLILSLGIFSVNRVGTIAFAKVMYRRWRHSILFKSPYYCATDG